MSTSGSNLESPGGGAPAGSGIAPNLAGALSYALGLITGVLFLFLDRNPFVRFHAYQSIFLTVAWVVFWIAVSILEAILGIVPGVRFLVAILAVLGSLVLSFAAFILWIVLIVKAYQGQRWKLPYIGDMAERYARSGNAEST